MLRFDFDTEPHPIFHEYSAGNFGEVAPERLSIASWSLIGPPVERACRALAARLWPRASWHLGPQFVFVGYFACRPYHNLSGVCHMAGEVPRLSSAAVTACYFEDAPPPASLRIARGSPLSRLLGVPRMLQELARSPQRCRRIEGEVSQLEHEVDHALSRGHGFRVGAVSERAVNLLSTVWDAHYLTTMVLVPLDATLRAVGSRAVANWDEIALQIVQPHELPWASLEDARATGMRGEGEFLARPFYEIADEHEPWRGFATRLDAGQTELRERHSSQQLAEVCWEIAPHSRTVLLPQLVELVGEGLAAREHTKATAMRCMHVFRRLLPRLAQLRSIPDDAWPYLTAVEMLGHDSASALESRANMRAIECQLAVTEPAPHTLALDNSDEFIAQPIAATKNGRGVSAGVARGTAVRPEEIGISVDGPRIIVCDAADADLQPLLAGVSGVLTARGSALSHVSILMREYGIPAVVGHHLASRVRTGQLLTLNGTTGEVTLIT